MEFIAHTQEELKSLNIKEDTLYLIEYQNRDYFNGETTIEKTKAKAIINNGIVSFIVPDPYGMDRFINEVRVVNF